MRDPNQTPEEFLAHYGVKGMKWGVRQRHIEKQQKKVDRLERVAEGKGSLRDKARTLATSSAGELAMRGGLKNTAKYHAEITKEHIDRVNKGEKKVRDVLIMAGTLTVADIIAGGRDKYRKANR